MALKNATAKFSQLHLTDTNVRKVQHDPQKIEEIAASILSIGVLQALVVTERKGGKRKEYDVIAGGGRYRAIANLIEQHPEMLDMEVPIRILDDASKAIEASLIENDQRQQMRLSETSLAFMRMREENPALSLADIAATFGYEPQQAARVMRLAAIAPELMEHWLAGRLTDAQAIAFAATEDRALQVQVFSTINQHTSALAIKRALAVGEEESTKMLRFVGMEAYREAGGTFEADLFSDDSNCGRVTSPAILLELFDRAISEEKERLAARLERFDGEGNPIELAFSWADTPPQISEYGSSYTDWQLAIRHLERGELSDADAARYETISDRLAEIEESGDESDEIGAEYERLETELISLDAQRSFVLPVSGDVVGVIDVDHEGNAGIEFFYANRAAKGIATPKGATVRAAGAVLSPAEAERARFGLSKDAMQAMMLLRRDMIREELWASAQTGSTLALDFLLYTQARTILHATPTYSGRKHFAGADLGTLNLGDDNGDVPGKQHDMHKQRPERARWEARLDQMRSAPWATAHDPIAGFALFRSADADTRNQCAALVAGHQLVASTAHYSDGRTPRMVCELANYLENEPGFVRWRDGVELDEAFFSKFSHKARLVLLDQWGMGDRAKGMKASESAAFCARVANCDEADAQILGFHPDDLADAVNWLPAFLETAPVEPLPEPAEVPNEDHDDDNEDDAEAAGDDPSEDLSDLHDAEDDAANDDEADAEPIAIAAE